MQPPPQDWPRISSSLFYEDAAAALDWLSRAFGFEVQLRIEGEGGRIEHSQLVFGSGLVMVSSAGASEHRGESFVGRSPQTVGGMNTQMLAVFVDDVDAHCERARAAGATIVDEPSTIDYGDDYWSDRSYRAMDAEGHHWWFMQRLRGPKIS